MRFDIAWSDSHPPAAAAPDDVLQALDLSPKQFRTVGGAINRGRLRAAIQHPAEYLPPEHWLRASATRAVDVALKSAIARANRLGIASTDAIRVITEYVAVGDAARAAIPPRQQAGQES